MGSAQQVTGGKHVSVPVRQRFLKTHALPHGMCENLINALKLFGDPAERW